MNCCGLSTRQQGRHKQPAALSLQLLRGETILLVSLRWNLRPCYLVFPLGQEIMTVQQSLRNRYIDLDKLKELLRSLFSKYHIEVILSISVSIVQHAAVTSESLTPMPGTPKQKKNPGVDL